MNTQIRTAPGATNRSDVRFCRIAAMAGVWGAVLVPGALLAGCYLVFVDGSVDRMTLALVATAVAAGIALMVMGRRLAERGQPSGGAAEGAAMRLVAGAPTGPTVGDRRSAA
jgi:hypothetical protein